MSARLRIIAVDPGGVTGVRYYDTETGECEPSFGISKLRQHKDRLRFCETVEAQIDRWNQESPFESVKVVCEDFIITSQTAKKSRQPDAIKIIGALDYICHRHGADLILQRPGDAKRFATDKRLKAAGLWDPGMRHANDAARHLFLYLCKYGYLNAVEVDQRAAC